MGPEVWRGVATVAWSPCLGECVGLSWGSCAACTHTHTNNWFDPSQHPYGLGKYLLVDSNTPMVMTNTETECGVGSGLHPNPFRHALTPNTIRTGLSFSKLNLKLFFSNHIVAVAKTYVHTKFDAKSKFNFLGETASKVRHI